MINIHFPKLYRYERKGEHCGVAIPFSKGEFKEGAGLSIRQGDVEVPVQLKVTSRYDDNSARFVYARFMADLPANRGTELGAFTLDKPLTPAADHGSLTVSEDAGSIIVKNGAGLEFEVKDGAESIFSYLKTPEKTWDKDMFAGPFLKDGNGGTYGIRLGNWRISERGPLVAVLRCLGSCEGDPAEALNGGSTGGTGEALYGGSTGGTGEALNGGSEEAAAGASKGGDAAVPAAGYRFELRLTAYAEKPWVEIAFRLINATEAPLHVASLVFAVKRESGSSYQPKLKVPHSIDRGDSKGEGSVSSGEPDMTGPVYETTGTKYLEQIEKKPEGFKVRTCVASSNYKTNFEIGDGASVERVIDAKYIIGEANEHFIEVFYGTLFADLTDGEAGVCATIFQAQQNYPKAVKADESGIYVMLVPEDVEKVVMQPGMSREQRFLLHFHPAGESLAEIDNRSLIYQMPDRPWIDPEVFAASGVMPDIFVDREKVIPFVERSLIAKCDSHGRAFGMMNFGDCPDMHYTEQGRGKGNLVWSNNEYDYPHACALLYARTGERRFLDYAIAAAGHWMDVDVCHYSTDPLLIGGQWEHTQGHCVEGCMVCSHEWVEGLLDVYHLTGDERALETALGIGENINALLETPAYQVSGESNARETGWALRSLTALYLETGDEKWIKKARWITGHFREWTDEYGGWLSPYTDNTAIRVGFMISIAVGSLMRYYRVFPSEELKVLILSAVDDLMENCYMANGVFFYKELPSLDRLGTNPLLLEALAIAFELTGDMKYLKAGETTFLEQIEGRGHMAPGKKKQYGDAVVEVNNATKNFAQSFMPLSVYYKAISEYPDRFGFGFRA